MNRQIKFRGKRIDNGEWVYGYLYYKWRTKQYVIHCGPNTGVNVDTEHEVDPETVGQFTGLKDKNGVEAYEGDIVRNSNRTLITLSDDDRLYVVEWIEGKYGEIDNGPTWLMDKPGFIFKKIHKGMNLIFSQSQIEVIGNIHETPNLLQP